MSSRTPAGSRTGAEAARPAESVPAGLLRAVRPRQWVKNILVTAAPLAAGVLFRPDVALAVVGAFVAFTVSASGVYLLNDVLDYEADRAHPRKRSRPIASDVVPRRLAAVLAAVLLVVGPLIGWWAGGRDLALVLGVYSVVQIAYCLRLKHIAVMDIAVVASGFLLRAIGGAAAADLSPSQWFLLVTAFGSLFMVAGKRYAEMAVAGVDAATIRRSLTDYSTSYLRFVWTLSATATALAYSLWAFEISEGATSWATLSIAPFLLALLRYAVDVDGGEAGAPEDIVSGDRVLQVLGLLWLAFLCLAVYV